MMRNPSPIYNLLHQEIKACAEHLLEQGQIKTPDSASILQRLNELLEFAGKVRPDEHYHPLRELKVYLENTTLNYEDGRNNFMTIRLSEVVALLGKKTEFKYPAASCLTKYFLDHFLKVAKPGGSLFQKLTEIKKI